jgi:hypothetical protein
MLERMKAATVPSFFLIQDRKNSSGINQEISGHTGGGEFVLLSR